jgi:hypothetical protein
MIEQYEIIDHGSRRPQAERILFCDGTGGSLFREETDLELSHWIHKKRKWNVSPSFGAVPRTCCRLNGRGIGCWRSERKVTSADRPPGNDEF